MAADTPKTIPAQITAGDTARWQRSYPDYPASAGWSLAYYLVSSSAQITFTSTADGDAHLVLVPATTTDDWAAGEYHFQEYATKAGERYTLATGVIRILPNFAAATSGRDARSHASKVLDAIEAWLESRSSWAAEVAVAGRTLKQMPVSELFELRDRYRAEVKREEQAARIAQGLAGGHRVLCRF